MSKIIITPCITKEIWRDTVERLNPRSVHIFTDSNVVKLLPSLLSALGDLRIQATVTEAGEEHKNMQSLSRLWSDLTERNLTRKSLLISIGGGMVTDMGGFGAATFKRGIRHINITTTLLGAVDASVGGKTGINFGGLKNQVGVFSSPEYVIIPTEALQTLPRKEMLSGMGEVIKTALISSGRFYRDVTRHIGDMNSQSWLAEVIERCIDFKESVVNEDPYEKGRRKILNFGHTAGHAIESLLLSRGCPLPHGVAVAYGILYAMVLSHLLFCFSKEILFGYAREVIPHFPPLGLTRDDQDALIALMHSDKKNSGPWNVSFTLLTKPGHPKPDVQLDDSVIKSSFDTFFNLLNIN